MGWSSASETSGSSFIPLGQRRPAIGLARHRVEGENAENDASAPEGVSARRLADEEPHQEGTEDRLQEQDQGDLGGGKDR